MWLGFRSLFSAEAVYFLRRMGPDVPLVFSYHLDVYRGGSWRDGFGMRTSWSEKSWWVRSPTSSHFLS
jgi:hypothetical protein